MITTVELNFVHEVSELHQWITYQIIAKEFYSRQDLYPTENLFAC